MHGTIQSYDPNRGYGFIRQSRGRYGMTIPIFFHISAFKRFKNETIGAPPRGAEVRFDLVQGVKGRAAANIELVLLQTKCKDAYPVVPHGAD